MGKQLNDKEFDRVMGSIIADAEKDQREINEIADSPALWWAIQRNIAVEGESHAQPWPPSSIFRWLKVAVPAFAVLVLGIGIYWVTYNGQSSPQLVASEPPVEKPAASVIATQSEPKIEIETPVEPAKLTKTEVSQPISAKDHRVQQSARAKSVRPASRQSDQPVRSEFIALTYGDKPDSGHVVRVKVPSSMMVTLGLVATVEKPTNLIDAEVLVGDDGMTHSIRFIR